MRIATVVLVAVLYALGLLRVTEVRADRKGEPAPSATAQDQSGVEELKSSVVRIVSKAADGQPRTGAGFIVRVDGELVYIATAAHVITGDMKPQVTFYFDKRRPVAAEPGDLEIDNLTAGLGYVIVRDPAVAKRARPLGWSSVMPRGGEQIVAIGFNQGAGEWGVSTGTVASVSGSDIRIDARVDEGNSGGPILMNGSVVGMVTSLRQGFGVAKSGIVVQSTLRGWDIEISAPTTAGTGTPVDPAPTTTRPTRRAGSIGRAPLPGDVESGLSPNSWGGVWDLRFEFQGNWSKRLLNMEATQSGVTGDYGLGTLEGRFRQGDVTTVNGTITNTTNTGTTCRSGKQEGSFSLTLAKDGRSMAGWWDVCSEGPRYKWEADKR
ncbi:MAG: serine protease [Vicinamibacterales bacterium]